MEKLLFGLLLTIVLTSNVKAGSGDSLFSMAQVHDVYMTFTQPNYWDSLTAYYSIDKYLKGDITVDGVAYVNVGIKFKGNSSYSNPSDKKSFKVDLTEFGFSQDVDGLKKFNLNNGFKDPTFLREKLALDFCNAHGIAAPRCAFSRVFINGTYWGLYTFVEEADKGKFLNQRFGNKQGNYFKGDPSGDLKWINATPSSYYSKYELKNNTTVNDWSDLVNLIDKINNSGTYFHDSLQTVLSTSHFIKYWAMTNLFVNLDSYIGSGHNYFIYDDTTNNKFEWVAWDVNESFGNFNMGMTPTQIKNLSFLYVSSPSTSRPLVDKMKADPAYVTELAGVLCDWLQWDFGNYTMDGKIDSLANAIRTDVYADTKKFYTNTQFEDDLTMDITVAGGPGGGGTILGLKPFIAARRSALAIELAAYSCTVGINESAVSTTGIKVYPNPASGLITIEFNNSKKENSVRIYNALGQEMTEKISPEPSLNIDLSAFSQGVYFLNVNNEQFQKIQVVH